MGRSKGRGYKLLLAMLVLFLSPLILPAQKLSWEGQSLEVAALDGQASVDGPVGARVLLAGKEIARRKSWSLGEPTLIDLDRKGTPELLLPWYGGGTARSLLLDIYRLESNGAQLICSIGEDGEFLRGSWSLQGSTLIVEHELAGYAPQANGLRRSLYYRLRGWKLRRCKVVYEEPKTFGDQMNLAWAYFGEGRSVEAVARLRQVLEEELGPWERADAGELLSRILRLQGKTEEAVQEARAGIASAPEAPSARKAADRLLKEKLSRLGTPLIEGGLQ